MGLLPEGEDRGHRDLIPDLDPAQAGPVSGVLDHLDARR